MWITASKVCLHNVTWQWTCWVSQFRDFQPCSESSSASSDEKLPVQLVGKLSRLVPILLCSLEEVELAWEEAEDALVKLPIDLFGLYVLSSHFRPCDGILQTCIHVHMHTTFMKKQKANFKWPEFGKLNIQAKKVYLRDLTRKVRCVYKTY